MPEETPKPKCPECSTELVLVEGKLPKKCPKPECGFPLAGYNVFKRWFDTANKKATPAKTKTDDDDDNPFSVLGSL